MVKLQGVDFFSRVKQDTIAIQHADQFLVA